MSTTTASVPLRSFVQTHLFVRTAEDAGIGDEELRELEGDLRRDPGRGDTVAETGGARKIRAAVGGRGKRGGARVMYYYVGRDDTIYLLLAYGKGVQENLTQQEKTVIRKLVAQL